MTLLQRAYSLLLLSSIATVAIAGAPAVTLHAPQDSRTLEGVYQNDRALSYWHSMGLRCPLSKHDQDDIDFVAMIVIQSNDGLKLGKEQADAAEKEGIKLADSALTEDHDAACQAVRTQLESSAESWLERSTGK